MKIEQELLLLKLGKRLKRLRITNGFGSQENFANICDLSRSQYSRYENGMNITLLILYKIIKVHKISLDNFFSEGFEDVKDLLEN